MGKIIVCALIITCLSIAAIPGVTAFTATLVDPASSSTVLHDGDSISIRIDDLADGQWFYYHVYTTDMVPSGTSFTFSNVNMPFRLDPYGNTMVLETTGLTTPTIVVSKHGGGSASFSGSTGYSSSGPIPAGVYDITVSGTPSGTTVGVDLEIQGVARAPITNPSVLTFTLSGVDSGHLPVELDSEVPVTETFTIEPETAGGPAPMAFSGYAGSPSGDQGPGDEGGGAGAQQGPGETGEGTGSPEESLGSPQMGPTGGASGTYSLGFSGFNYNTDGGHLLSIDMDEANTAGVDITLYNDHVNIYQHNSPGVLSTFWSKDLATTGHMLTGHVTRAEFTTDPLEATLEPGPVSGYVHALIPQLIRPVTIKNTISGDVDPATTSLFKDALSQNNLALRSTAYTLDVNVTNMKPGAANITLNVPAGWVMENGGIDAVRITRISSETGQPEVLETTCLGLDPSGNMIFQGDSPDGTSLFGLVTASATAAEQRANPEMTYVPASKSAVATNVGMMGWLSDLVLNNPLLIVIVIAIVAAVAYFGWWRRRL